MDITDIRNLNPCYDPSKYLKEDWEGTVLDFLQIEEIPAADRLWVVLRTDFIKRSILKRFTLNCAKHVKHLTADERSLKALEVTEAYLEGKESIEQLKLARVAAYAAARAAYADAYANATYAATAVDAAAADAVDAAAAYEAAAYASAYAADAAAAYAYADVRAAAYEAAHAACVAYASAACAAYATERLYQIDMLIELLKKAG